MSSARRRIGNANVWSRKRKREAEASLFLDAGAGNEARTRDLNLGKVALYQLSYSRKTGTRRHTD